MDLSNKKWLYVTGCSHTAGCEVLTPGDGLLTHKGLQKSWSGLLAEHYKLNLINEAYPGAGLIPEYFSFISYILNLVDCYFIRNLNFSFSESLSKN